MTIQTAIKRAIEGGYRSDFKPDVLISMDMFVSELTRKKEKVLLDPLFWQALGKAMGWYEDHEVQYMVSNNPTERRAALIHIEDTLGVPLRELDDRVVYSPYTHGKKSWKENMHGMIDALASGSSIEDFFETL